MDHDERKVGVYPPMSTLDYVVHRLSPRRVRGRCNSPGPWGVRLGPRARVSLSQQFGAPKKMPPGARRASPREMSQILVNPLQMGYPAPRNTDACLGLSVMAYQSWATARGHCEAFLSTLSRIEGRQSKGRAGEKAGNLCQRAKVGYCPR